MSGDTAPMRRRLAMQPSATVVVLGRSHAAEIASALAAAAWPEGAVPTSISACPWPTNDDLCSLKAAAIVLVDHGIAADVASPTRDELLEHACVEGIPIVVLGGRRAGESGLHFPVDASPATIAAALAGLLERGEEIDRLARDFALTSRVADGVQAELTRMDEELQMAALLQQEFLPRTSPIVEGVEIATLWRPAGGVSGDVYDIMRLDEQHIGVFLADAVGHGMPAALMAMQLCRALETRDHHDRFHRIVPPCEALSRLNALMADRQGRVGRYASAVYAVIDCRHRIVRLATAGGPPPIIIGSDGHLRIMPATGLLLGMLPQQEYEEFVVELADDDHLLLHSDGFEQAFRDNGASSSMPHLTPRHLDEIARLRETASCSEAISKLVRRLDGEEGSLHPADDCTLVLLRARARAARLAA